LGRIRCFAHPLLPLIFFAPAVVKVRKGEGGEGSTRREKKGYKESVVTSHGLAQRKRKFLNQKGNERGNFGFCVYQLIIIHILVKIRQGKRREEHRKEGGGRGVVHDFCSFPLRTTINVEGRVKERKGGGEKTENIREQTALIPLMTDYRVARLYTGKREDEKGKGQAQERGEKRRSCPELFPVPFQARLRAT